MNRKTTLDIAILIYCITGMICSHQNTIEKVCEKMHNLGDVYLAVFAPKYIGKDGKITRREAVNKVLERREEFEYGENTLLFQ